MLHLFGLYDLEDINCTGKKGKKVFELFLEGVISVCFNNRLFLTESQLRKIEN